MNSSDSHQRWTSGLSPARDRIQSGMVVPVWDPSFRIDSSQTIFATGSCLARNLESALANTPLRLTSIDPDNPLMEIRTNPKLGLLNKYNPVSIHQELAWASDHGAFPETAFVEHNGRTYDPCLRMESPQLEKPDAIQRRNALRDYFRRAFEADVVILTLGLIETWYDRETKLALTEAPPPRIAVQHPGRFALKILSQAECFAVMKSVCHLLMQTGKPDKNIIVTVSPVAMERTFTGQDVLIANMMSKATLRSAAGQLAAEFDGVDYFPSYEAAMYSDPRLVWQADRRNVTAEFVNTVVHTILKGYGFEKAPALGANVVNAL